MADRDGLENRCTRKGTEGSNPSLSANVAEHAEPVTVPRRAAERADPGEVSEWLKEHAWKVCIGETLSRVRIPPSPRKCRHRFLEAGPQGE